MLDVAACPEDEGALERHDDDVRCTTCGRVFAVEGGVLTLLPDRLAHVRQPTPAPEARSGEEDVRWIEDELEWWNPWHDAETLQPFRPRSGLRGRSREKHLLGRVRGRVGDHPIVIEMGAGVSRTVAGLWPEGSAVRRHGHLAARPAGRAPDARSADRVRAVRRGHLAVPREQRRRRARSSASCTTCPTGAPRSSAPAGPFARAASCCCTRP